VFIEAKDEEFEEVFSDDMTWSPCRTYTLHTVHALTVCGAIDGQTAPTASHSQHGAGQDSVCERFNWLAPICWLSAETTDCQVVKFEDIRY